MSKTPTKYSFRAQALLIDTEPTTYNTRFKANALQQVADKINNDGLPLMLAHDNSKLPVGAWYEAEVKDDSVMSKFYVPQEISEYADIKTRIEADILDSVSIGFNAGVHDCSICGNDIQNYEACPHIPGKTYTFEEKEATCYVILDDIRVSEASLVYAGAVPQAKIIDSSDKAEFFTQNKLNFGETILETIHSGEVSYIEAVKNEGDQKMDDELKDKLSDLTTKYQDTREEVIDLKSSNFDLREKADGYAKALEDLAVAETKYSNAIEAIAAEASALAAPFDAEYKAPGTIDDLVADITKYLDLAKALPTGQQSHAKEAIEYSEPDDVFKV